MPAWFQRIPQETAPGGSGKGRIGARLISHADNTGRIGFSRPGERCGARGPGGIGCGCGYWYRSTDDHLRSRRRHGPRVGAPRRRCAVLDPRHDRPRGVRQLRRRPGAGRGSRGDEHDPRSPRPSSSAPTGGTAHCWPSSWPASTSSPAAGWWSASPSVGGTTTTSPPAPTSPAAARRRTPCSPRCARCGPVSHAVPRAPSGRPRCSRAARRCSSAVLGAAAIRRTTSLGAGWISGGGGPAMFADAAGRVRAAWTAAGREGAPRLVALGYYALGPDGPDAARRYLSDYYAFAGPYADQAAEAALTDPDAVRRAAARVRRGGLRRADPVPVLARSRPGRPARRGRAALTPTPPGRGADQTAERRLMRRTSSR